VSRECVTDSLPVLDYIGEWECSVPQRDRSANRTILDFRPCFGKGAWLQIRSKYESEIISFFPASYFLKNIKIFLFILASGRIFV